MASLRPDDLPSTAFVDQLVALAEEEKGQGFATVEQVVVGPTTRPGMSWLVVLYRSTAVKRGAQLIALGSYLSEESYRTASEEEMTWSVRDFWDGVIDEPPGSDLPRKNLNPGGIAWWRKFSGWTVQTGPPEDGLPAVRVIRLDQRSPKDRVEKHWGALRLLRSTHVYEAVCSCGWQGEMTDEGRARRALSDHYVESGAVVPTQVHTRPTIVVEDW